jgi:hypothetical protein
MACSLQIGDDFVVCDAGGSTIDTTLYTVSDSSLFPSSILITSKSLGEQIETSP